MAPGKLAGGLLGLMAGSEALGRPEEAQAAAIPGIGDELVRRARNVVAGRGGKAAVPVGTVEQLAFDTAKKLDPRITTSNAYAGPHAVVVRSAVGDMPMEDVATQLENLLNSKTAFAIPNIPLRDPTKHRDSAGIFVDPQSRNLFAVPFSGRRDGGILFYTGFPPTGKNYAFVQSRVKDFYNTHPELRPSGETLHSSHLRSQGLPPAVAQRPGFSAVGEPAFKEISSEPSGGKMKMPGIASLGLLPGGPLSPSLDLRWDSPRAVQTTAPANTQPRGFSAVESAPYPESRIQSRPADVNNSISSNALRQLGLGARATMEGLGNSLSLGLADPGRVLADWVGLPAPAPGTPEASVSNAVRGGADVMGWIIPGTGVARTAAGPVARGAGQAISVNPGTQVVFGSGLGYAADRLGGLLGLMQEDRR